MRTRAQSSNTTIPAGEATIHLVTPTPGDVSNPASAYEYQSLNEIITDQLPFRLASGSCAHSRTTVWILDQPIKSSTYVSGSGGTQFHTFTGAAFVRGLGSGIGTWTEEFNPSHGFNWSYASYSALEAMKPSFEEMLLPNFLKELSESSLALAKKAKTKLKQIERRRIRDLQKRIRNKGKILPKNVVPPGPIWDRAFGWFRKAANKLSWVNLAWQFAVRPTLDDAQAIGRIIDTFKSELSELIRKAGQLQRRHYRRPCDIIDLPAEAVRATGQISGTYWIRYWSRYEWYQRPVYHASCLFDYNASKLRGMLGQLDSLIHSFGVSKMASVIWEAIPYSFAVDWFVSVGDFIDKLEDSILDPLPIVIHDFSHSLKYEYKTILTGAFSYNNQASFGDAFDYYVKRRLVYERRRDVPSLWDSLSARTPNLNQIGLGLSIIELRLDGINRKKSRKR